MEFVLRENMHEKIFYEKIKENMNDVKGGESILVNIECYGPEKERNHMPVVVQIISETIINHTAAKVTAVMGKFFNSPDSSIRVKIERF